MNTESLAGIAVALTRPIERNGELIDLLRGLGADVTEVPLIEIGPPNDRGAGLRSALEPLEQFDWIAVLSTNGATALLRALEASTVPSSSRIVAVGSATQSALSEGGLDVDLVGDGSGGASLARQLSEVAAPGRVLAISAEEGRHEFRNVLEASGWDVTTVAGYATVPAATTSRGRTQLAQAHVVVFASPSAVASFEAVVPVPRSDQVAVAIGETTATAARRIGFGNVVVAEAPTDVALATAVVGAVQSSS